MADLNPMVSGDVPYPQYSVVTTQNIDAGVTILKGVIYTKNTDGELVVSTGDLTKGIYQATATPTTNVPALVGDEVQCLGPRTRILMADSAGGLVAGDNVINTTNTNEVTVIGVTTGVNYIGRVFEIYTRNTDSSKKIVAAAADLVVIETVGP